MCCFSCCSVKQQKIWTFGTGVTLVILGLLSSIGGPPLVRKLVRNELALRPNSVTYEKWSVTPIPIYLNMFLFNWTNTDQIGVAGVKPNFEQIGPYVFEQRTSKEKVRFHPENATVSFRNKRVWTFNPEMSNGTLEDLITAPHLPSIAAANYMKNANAFIKRSFNRLLNANGGSLYQTHTANEWMFEGFEDKFLKFASTLPLPFDLRIFKEEFGWFIKRNGSEKFESVFNVKTGEDDITQLGEIQSWRYKNTTGFYEGECGKLNGSTSDIFPPDLAPDDVITIFVVDTTRIINLSPTDKEVSIKGIKGRRYETTADTFDNGQRNPNMLCFCPSKLRPDNCPPSGATFIGPIALDAPVYLSHPNFLYADPHYADTITGLRPDFESDIFSITLEPTLSIPLDVQANVQVNVKIEKDSQITILSNVSDYFYAPMFIVRNKAYMSDEIAREVKFAVAAADIVRYCGYAFFFSGIILLIVAIWLTKTNNWHGQSHDL